MSRVARSQIEPSPESMSKPWRRWFFAVRPAFLTVSVVAWAIGLAKIHYDGIDVHAGIALASLLVALAVHAGVNVVNDYYDHLNGSDADNRERVYPFTGGSRFIQNGIMTATETLRYGLGLLSLGMGVGLLLALWTDPSLLWLGALGVIVGWAYSAPPLALNSRGLGELCVAVGFGILIPAGSAWVQSGAFHPAVIPVALPYALLTVNILYLNQFPDWKADERADKRHLVVRLGPDRGRWVYPGLTLASAVALMAAVSMEFVPRAAWLSLLPLILGLHAAFGLAKHVHAPQELSLPIKETIFAALSHGLILSAVLWLAATD